ncbi:hypothetical protein [Caryophanon latum]|uniref:Uncharacterized protein n=1 Tax=Caryophanon latum TaxID=33977 RepID=A0A1C0YUY9_9BACL|nr:hypothetical protein [Caryophanon latum]OCS90965.1 hypothetical protein A6K76_10355 [Caryophanon latum]
MLVGSIVFILILILIGKDLFSKFVELLEYIFDLIVECIDSFFEWIESLFTSKKRTVNSYNSISKEYTSKSTEKSTASSPSKSEKPQPKIVNAALDLFQLYQDTDVPLQHEKYYAMKSTDFKINLPIIKIFNTNHEQVGIMNLQDSAVHSDMLDDRCAYEVSIDKVSSTSIQMNVYVDKMVTHTLPQFSFVEASQLPSEQSRNEWLSTISTSTLDETERAELAYLGPNWRISEKYCSRCGSLKYEIEARNISIKIQQEQKSIDHMFTCLTCEVIEAPQCYWQAASETEYNARTQYISSKS